MYDINDWKSICRNVASIAFPIFPHIKKKSVRSAIISNLFETQSELYFNTKGINTKSSKNDQEPDLYFVDQNVPLELKVTGIDDTITCKTITWLGGRYSKRNSDHVFIMWKYTLPSIMMNEPDMLSFAAIKTFVSEDDWKELSNSKDYYGLGFKSPQFDTKEYDMLVGDYTNNTFILEHFKNG